MIFLYGGALKEKPKYLPLLPTKAQSNLQINIMAEDSLNVYVIDPEKVQEEFRKKEEAKIKLQELKKAVFRSYTIKKSKSVLHPTTIKKRQPTSPIHKPQHSQNHLPQNIPSITTIRFGNKQNKQSELKPTQSLNKLPAFSPRKSNCELRKTIFQIQTNRRQIYPQPQFRMNRNTIERVKQLSHRDSQTILRKNSLFLVNCLKTRYRQTEKKAHIGDANSVGNMRLGFFSEKNLGATHYHQRFEYMEEARQRLLLGRNLQGEEFRQMKTTQLHPQPW